MALNPKLDQTIQDFQALMKHPQYDALFAALVMRADHDHISVIPYTGSQSSRCFPFPTGYEIWLKTVPMIVGPLEILFDLMHELGHCYDERTQPAEGQNQDEFRLARERRAWKWADKEFDQHPELLAVEGDYERYRHECLLSYRQPEGM